jgi:diazepam-binding inhibitor (GABA receptor modulator, acyl-CoA-binding protein)
MRVGFLGHFMLNLAQRFAAAQKAVQGLNDARLDNDTLLELYSYFRRATEGNATGPRPGAFDFVARAKHDAWAARKSMSQDVAMGGYIKLVKHLQLLE